MKESFADKVKKGVDARVEMAASQIAKQLGNVKPFDQVKMTPQERIREFDELLEDPEGLARLRNDPDVGDEGLMDWADEINRLRGGL